MRATLSRFLEFSSRLIVLSFCLGTITYARAQPFNDCMPEYEAFLRFTDSAILVETDGAIARVTSLRARCAPPLFDDPESIQACQNEIGQILDRLNYIRHRILPEMELIAHFTNGELARMIDVTDMANVGFRKDPLDFDDLSSLTQHFMTLWFQYKPTLSIWRGRLNYYMSRAVVTASSPAMTAIGANLPVHALNVYFRRAVFYWPSEFRDFVQCHMKSSAQIMTVAGVQWGVVRQMVRLAVGGRDSLEPADSGGVVVGSPPASGYPFKNYEFLGGPSAIRFDQTRYDVDLSKFPRALDRRIDSGTYQSSSSVGLVYETIPIEMPKPFLGVEVQEVIDGLPIPIPFVMPAGWSICANQRGHGGDIENASFDELERMVYVDSDGHGGKCVYIPTALPWFFRNGSDDPTICTTMPHVVNSVRPFSFKGCHNLVYSRNTPPNPKSIGQLTPLDERFLVMHSPGKPGGDGFVKLEMRFSDRYSNPNPTKPECFQFNNWWVFGSSWTPIRPTPPGCNT